MKCFFLSIPKLTKLINSSHQLITTAFHAKNVGTAFIIGGVLTVATVGIICIFAQFSLIELEILYHANESLHNNVLLNSLMSTIIILVIPVVIGGFGNLWIFNSTSKTTMDFPILNIFSLVLWYVALSMFILCIIDVNLNPIGLTFHPLLFTGYDDSGLVLAFFALSLSLISSVLAGFNFLVTLLDLTNSEIKLSSLMSFNSNTLFTLGVVLMLIDSYLIYGLMIQISFLGVFGGSVTGFISYLYWFILYYKFVSKIIILLGLWVVLFIRYPDYREGLVSVLMLPIILFLLYLTLYDVHYMSSLSEREIFVFQNQFRRAFAIIIGQGYTNFSYRDVVNSNHFPGQGENILSEVFVIKQVWLLGDGLDSSCVMWSNGILLPSIGLYTLMWPGDIST